MSVERILSTVAERGLVLLRNGSNLRLEGPRSAIDPALIGMIRESKSELLKHLQAAPTNDDGRIALTPMQASYYYGRQDHFSMGGVSSHVYREIEGVFDAVEMGFCDFGVLPIENSSNGSVRAVYDLLQTKKVSIVRSTRLCISHELLAKPGAKLSGITEIHSHEQALGQCSEFLKKLGDKVKIVADPNTAMAA